MTSQLRYRTLVDNLARIYDATDDTRTCRLQEGLTKVLETIDPKSADGWQHVKVDSMRLLRVWRAREDCPGDSTLADQILEALTDFATEDVPRLEITERPVAAAAEPRVAETRIAAHVPIPVVIEKPMTPAEIRAIEAALDAVEENEDEAEAIEAALAGAEEDEVEVEEEEEEVEVDEEAIALPAPVPAAVTVTEAEVEEVASETTEEEEEEVASEKTEEEEEEEEVVEPEADSESEAEEEEEEGVEVEKRTIRGREYWLSSDGTLYAVADDDEIGEEVGRINKDGRPVFLAPK
jgi:hypothetical protein